MDGVGEGGEGGWVGKGVGGPRRVPMGFSHMGKVVRWWGKGWQGVVNGVGWGGMAWACLWWQAMHCSSMVGVKGGGMGHGTCDMTLSTLHTSHNKALVVGMHCFGDLAPPEWQM